VIAGVIIGKGGEKDWKKKEPKANPSRIKKRKGRKLCWGRGGKIKCMGFGHQIVKGQGRRKKKKWADINGRVLTKKRGGMGKDP